MPPVIPNRDRSPSSAVRLMPSRSVNIVRRIELLLGQGDRVQAPDRMLG